ncbi:MAG: ion channel [Verrucomicrobiota bacterium]
MIKLRKIRHIGAMRYSSIELLVTLVLLIMVTPFVEDMKHGSQIEAGMLTLVLISAGLAVGGRRRVMIIASMLLVPTLLAQWTHHLFPHLVSPGAHLVLGMLFIGFVVGHLLRFILRAARVDAEVLCAGISVYLMIGLMWALAYMLTGNLSASAFSFANDPDPTNDRTMTSFNAFYFSFTTLSTLGFGDIAPVSKVARTLAIMEAVTGMFYMAILISRLVSMYAPAAAATESETDSES